MKIVYQKNCFADPLACDAYCIDASSACHGFCALFRVRFPLSVRGVAGQAAPRTP
jgi:hypothetical protein